MCFWFAEYDVLLRDTMYWPAALLDDVLGIPSIDVLSAAPFQPMFGYYTGNPNPVAYLPQLGSGLTPNMVSLRLCPGSKKHQCDKRVTKRFTAERH